MSPSITNVNGMRLTHPARMSAAAARGSIMMSAMSFVANIDRIIVAPTSASTAERGVEKRATIARAARSNAPMLRSAPATARMQNRQMIVRTSR